jgi:hypothetical protein
MLRSQTWRAALRRRMRKYSQMLGRSSRTWNQKRCAVVARSRIGRTPGGQWCRPIALERGRDRHFPQSRAAGSGRAEQIWWPPSCRLLCERSGVHLYERHVAGHRPLVGKSLMRSVQPDLLVILVYLSAACGRRACHRCRLGFTPSFRRICGRLSTPQAAASSSPIRRIALVYLVNRHGRTRQPSLVLVPSIRRC